MEELIPNAAFKAKKDFSHSKAFHWTAVLGNIYPKEKGLYCYDFPFLFRNSVTCVHAWIQKSQQQFPPFPMSTQRKVPSCGTGQAGCTTSLGTKGLNIHTAEEEHQGLTTQVPSIWLKPFTHACSLAWQTFKYVYHEKLAQLRATKSEDSGSNSFSACIIKISEERLGATQDETSYHLFYCYGPLLGVPVKKWDPLEYTQHKQNKKALQPKISLELQDNKQYRHKQQWVHLKQQYLFLAGFVLGNKKLFSTALG